MNFTHTLEIKRNALHYSLLAKMLSSELSVEGLSKSKETVYER
ncbi:MAG: hypothetical protein ABSB84_15725 [Verrucomicrobiota bacterium]|jgi:hypothetical protein